MSDQLDRIEKKVDLLHNLIYQGNGKLPLLTRIDRAEEYIRARKIVESWGLRAIIMTLVGAAIYGAVLLVRLDQVT